MSVSKYSRIYKPGHPNAHAGGVILEHIFIMSEMLGRPLTDLEVVHHVDEDKRNNSPENLQLFATQAEHLTHHKHLRAMQDCGNPDYRKCRYCKQYGNPEEMVLSLSRGVEVHHHKVCKDLNSLERRSTPEGASKIKAAYAVRVATPEGRAKVNAANAKSRSTPEGKAKANAASVASRAKKRAALLALKETNGNS